MTVAMTCGIGALLIPAGTPEARLGDCKESVERRGSSGSWTRLGQPKWPEGPEGISTHAVDPENGTWYITNGGVVQVSKDDGCSFESIYALSDAAADSPTLGKSTARIDTLAANAGIIAVSIASPTVDGTRPTAGATHVVVSEDMGATWGDATALAGAGEPGPVVISRSNPSVIYAAAGKVLHRSSDGGASFSALSGLVLADPEALGYPQVAVDPSDEDTVFALTAAGIVRTTDGGESWDKPLEGAVTAGPAAASDGGPARVVALTTDADGLVNGWRESRDGGESFEAREETAFGEIDGIPTGTAFGGLDGDDLVVTSSGVRGGPDPAVHRWYPQTQRFMNFDEFDWGPMRGATPSEGGLVAHFHSDTQLYTWELPKGGITTVTPPAQKKLPFEFFDPPPPPKARPAKLKPGEGDIVIPVGGSTTVKYTLEVPAQPTRLDTFFLLDTSGSTGPYIDGLKVGIGRLIREMLRGYTDSNFGLGEYQDTGFESDQPRDADDDSTEPAREECQPAETVRYRRRADIRPPDQSFQKPLEAMVPCGGNEPGYTAVHQVATGAGVLEPKYGPRVKPGRGATWREDTMRVLFHVGDEPFYHDGGDIGGAGRQQTIDALKARKMKFIGVDMSSNTSNVGVSANGTQAPGTNLGGGKVDCTKYPAPKETTQGYLETPTYCYLRELAQETGTFAPRGGVDCNGDGKADVLEGEPLVCTLAQGDTGGGVIEMAEPVRSLLLAIPDMQLVTLTQEGLAEVGVAIKALDELDIDVHGDHDLGFEVTFSCNAAQDQKAFPVRLRATLKGKLAARADARAICGSLPAAPVPPAAESADEPHKAADKVATAPPVARPPMPVFAAPPLVPPAFAIVAAPPPPPVPVSNPAPAQAPASAPGTAGATAAAPGMVPVAALARAPSEVQVQRVSNDPTREEGKDELSFSGGSSSGWAETEEAAMPLGGSVGDEVGGEGAWVFRMLSTTALLAIAVALAPRRRHQRQVRSSRIR